MKQIMTTLATALLLTTATTAFAREPGVGNIVPPGATIGTPVGANPPPGFFFSSRSTLSFGELKDVNGDYAGVDVNAKATVLQIHYSPGVTIWGGDYRAMALLPLVHLDQTIGAPLPAFLHGRTKGFGLGDVTISPLNLSWMVEPGIFWSVGSSINVPTGKFDPNGLSFGTNAWGATLELGYSYLRDGWNATAHLVYSTHAENSETSYQSGDELLLNITALKNVGSFSIGPVGYWRKQIEDDVNNGAFYGGAASGRAEQMGLGVGFSKVMGGGELNVNIVHDLFAENAVSGTKVLINFSVPLGPAN